MKKQILKCVISLFLVMCVFVGCSGQVVNEHIDDPIALSGNLEYYSGLDKEEIKEKHIEITGVVSGKSSTYLKIGEISNNSYYFTCYFSDNTEMLENIEIGDTATVHGVCTSVLLGLIDMDGCQIVSVEKADNETTDTSSDANTEKTPSGEKTDTTDAETKKPETTKTETTDAPHQHLFVSATCTDPQKCSCGAIEGAPNGHNWQDATCTKPKVCIVCGFTEGSPNGHFWAVATCTVPKTCSTCGSVEGTALGHSWKDATYSSPKTCTRCGATEGNSLPVPGQANYHGHVYTGGAYSKKYHYEAHCAGKNSHEITWDEVERRGLGPCGTCVLK